MKNKRFLPVLLSGLFLFSGCDEIFQSKPTALLSAKTEGAAYNYFQNPSAFDSPEKKAAQKNEDFFLLENERPEIRLASWSSFPKKAMSIEQATQTHPGWKILEKIAHRDLERQSDLAHPLAEQKAKIAAQIFKDIGGPEKLAGKSAIELFNLSLQFVTRHIKPVNVDAEKKAGLPASAYLDLHKGDCFVFTILTLYAYSILKEAAKNNDVAFAMDHELGSSAFEIALSAQRMGIRDPGEGHMWVSFMLLDRDGVYWIAHVDPTWYASGAKSDYDASDARHIDKRLFFYRVFRKLKSNRGLLNWELHDDHHALSPSEMKEIFQWTIGSLAELRWYDSLHSYEEQFSADIFAWYWQSYSEAKDFWSIVDPIVELATSFYYTDYGKPLLEKMRAAQWDDIRAQDFSQELGRGTSYLDRAVPKGALMKRLVLESFPSDQASAIAHEIRLSEQANQMCRNQAPAELTSCIQFHKRFLTGQKTSN